MLTPNVAYPPPHPRRDDAVELIPFRAEQYTMANYKFAQSMEPENSELQKEVRRAMEALSRGEHTVPSTIAKELATNPFMRAHVPALQSRTGLGHGASTAQHLGAIRTKKNSFRG